MKLEDLLSSNPDAVAIIGMAGKFPKALNVDEFWENIYNDKDCISLLSKDQLAEAGVSLREMDDSSYVNRKGCLDAIDGFDSSFFGFTPNEAKLTDPQHRLFLEIAWDSLENAGYDPSRFNGDIGVFTSCGRNYYFHDNILSAGDLLNDSNRYSAQIKNDKDYLSTTTSFKFGLTGPSVNLNTACSSSLVSIHYACLSLTNFECDMAIAGATSVEIAQYSGYVHKEGMILSKDGICRPFDDAANGTVPGSGAAAVVLKRLEDAIKDRDYVYAVIIGSAVNNDGNLKINYSAPSVQGQSRAVIRAYENANVSPDTVDYMEAHGTGTVLGDPVEVEALKAGFQEFTDHKQFCAIGSVKGNIGHLDAAAGMAGLIKVTKALQNKVIPPLANFKTPNRNIDFDNSPFYINQDLKEWSKDSGPRRAAVNSLGIGGTNAHLILQEAPEDLVIRESKRPTQLFLFSAQNKEQIVKRYEAITEKYPEISGIQSLDLAFSLAQIKHFDFRGFTLLDGRKSNFGNFVSPLNAIKGNSVSLGLPSFNNYGASSFQVNDLYRNENEFRAAFDRCCNAAKKYLGVDLKQQLNVTSAIQNKLADSEITRLMNFSTQYALGRMLAHWGIKPQYYEAEGSGKFAAISLTDTLSVENLMIVMSLMKKQSFEANSLINSQQIFEMLSSNQSQIEWQSPNSPILILGQENKKHEVMINSIEECIEFLFAESFEHLVSSVEYRNIAEVTLLLSGDQTSFSSNFNSENSYITLNTKCPTEGNYQELMFAIGMAWSKGVDINWENFYEGEDCKRTPLPGYPFNRSSYWIAPNSKKEHWDDQLNLPDTGFGLYSPEWKSVVTDFYEVKKASLGHILLFSNQTGLSEEIELALKLNKNSVLKVAVAEQFSHDEINKTIYLNPSEEDHFSMMWAIIKSSGIKLTEVIYLWSVSDGEAPEKSNAEEDLCLHYPISILSTYAKSIIDSEMQIKFVTNGMHNITGSEIVNPDKSLLLGIVNTVPWEFSKLSTFAIDIDLGQQESYRTFANRILAERARFNSSSLIAYRGNHRWVRDYQLINPIENVEFSSNLRKSGVYLITGGVGGLGLEIAKALAEKCPESKLILVSRTALPKRDVWDAYLDLDGFGYEISNTIQQLKAIEALGPTIKVMCADISVDKDIEFLRQSIAMEFGQVNGIVHAAGIHHGALIRNVDREITKSVLKAKKSGTGLLNSYFSDSNNQLDFMILCSSVTAVKGGVGEVVYAAANAYLDAYVEANRKYGNTVLRSINWTAWKNTGMLKTSTKKVNLELTRTQTLSSKNTVFNSKSTFSSGAEKTIIFSGTLEPSKYWPFGEHQINDTYVLPATAFLELIAVAVEESFAQFIGARIDNINFINQISSNGEAVRLKLEILVTESAISFSFLSLKETTWIEAARGELFLNEMDVKSNGSTFTSEEIPFERKHLTFKQGKLSFGNRWQAISKKAELKGKKPTIQLKLLDAFQGDLTSSKLHPSILDVALYGISPDVADADTYFPFTIGSVRFHRPLEKSIQAHYSTHFRVNEKVGLFSYDVSIFDDHNNLLLEFERVSLKSVQKSSADISSATIEEKPDTSSKESNVGIDASEGVRFFLDSLSLPQYSRLLLLSKNSISEFENGLFKPKVESHSLKLINQPASSIDNEFKPEQINIEVKKVFEKVLGVLNVCDTDDFFDLGGDSLSAVQVIDELKRALSLPIDLDLIFDHPTPERLGNYIREEFELNEVNVAYSEREKIISTLKEIFESAIGVDKVGLEDDFFDLGGDSLSAIQLIDDIKKMLGFQLNVDTIFDYSNISKLTSLLISNTTALENSNLQEARTKQLISFIHLPTSVQKPSIQLFCFHHAGGGTANYKDWNQHLPSDVEVIIVQLPGRENLFKSAAFERIEPLIDLLIDVLPKHVVSPFMLFGHSMGGMIAFELSRKLQERGQSPIALNIAAFGAPSRYQTNSNPMISDYDLKEKLYEQQPTLRHLSEGVLDAMLPTIRADFALCDNYLYKHAPKLAIPINLFYSLTDSLVKASEMEGWSNETSKSITKTIIEGNHFFIETNKLQFLENLTSIIKANGEVYAE